MQNLYNTVIRYLNRALKATDSFIEWGGIKLEPLLSIANKRMAKTTKQIKKGYKKFLGLGAKKIAFIGAIAALVIGGLLFLWIATFELPRLDNFDERRIAQSTKIYDRTGQVVLFDVHGEITRTVVPLEEITEYVKWATIAIEDDNFYNHNGIEPSAIARAIITNILEGNPLGGQGGSTITQQVIKNALLTSEKKVSRKIKEWVLAPRLESILTKDEIIEIYLNEAPYGGTVYGVQEASRRFFGKDAKDLTLAESAYLAALPQRPTYYSPYGNHVDALESRKDRVLDAMLENGFISQEEHDQAMQEKVEFQKPENFGIKAAHFVFWVREQLEEEYGPEAVESGGLRVVTTLDWELQEQAEEIVKRYALENAEKFDAENAAIVAIDPHTGQVLAMVGSRDYFDEDIDGNFNITTAERQPGSAFKPFVYAEAFNKGYRPETVVFDLPTEFSTACKYGGNCYNPVNYDGVFRGPMSLRDALAQSVNIPAVKALYLAGLKDSLSLAKGMGLTTLTNTDQYGLTLVLGGGEVRPLDMAAAYSVFANEGVKHEIAGVLSVEDRDGKKIFEYEDESNRVLPEQTARLISDVLSDNVARTPAFGANSALNFPGIDVAAKTGTTNDYRDAWIVGYTPNVSIAAWAGNNDNRSMDKRVAGFIVAPMWNEVMQKAIELYPGGSFNEPSPINQNIKPIIAGFWRGEGTTVIDTETGEPADENTPAERRQVVTSGNNGGVHSILHWVDKSNPLGPIPRNPGSDPQYELWESAVQVWLGNQNPGLIEGNKNNGDRIRFSITNPSDGDVFAGNLNVYVTGSITGANLAGGTVLINDEEVGAMDPVSNSFSFVPDEIENIKQIDNTLTVIATDNLGNTHEDTVVFDLQ